MELWIRIVIGIIGFILGMGILSDMWNETYHDCITDLYESKDDCDIRVSNCMDKCDELIEGYQEIIEKLDKGLLMNNMIQWI